MNLDFCFSASRRGVRLGVINIGRFEGPGSAKPAGIGSARYAGIDFRRRANRLFRGCRCDSRNAEIGHFRQRKARRTSRTTCRDQCGRANGNHRWHPWEPPSRPMVLFGLRPMHFNATHVSGFALASGPRQVGYPRSDCRCFLKQKGGAISAPPQI